jgi:glycosyltransferase involved in cell wall biosynthesis
MEELISVIIPVYKVEEYLGRCVDSVLRQTYGNLEIILVDDGSPDRCGEICDEYAVKDSRVVALHKKNGGLSDARNQGLKVCRGEYITFVDSDDWVDENYIMKLYMLLKETDSDISVCNFIRTTREDVQPDDSQEKVRVFTNLEALDSLESKTDIDLYVQLVVAWGKLYRKELFEGITFPVGKLHEDEFTTYKLLYRANRIALTSAQLLYYWQREDSIMGVGFNARGNIEGTEALKERAEFYKKAGLLSLSSRAYKMAFLKSVVLSNRSSEIDRPEYRAKLENNLAELKKELRNTSQKPGFKLFYEIYCFAPKTMGKVYKAFERYKNG